MKPKDGNYPTLMKPWAKLMSLLAFAIFMYSCFGYANTDKPATTQTNTPKLVWKDNRIQNSQGAYVPAQCYTRTQSPSQLPMKTHASVTTTLGQTPSQIHNPCYACHANAKAPNYTNDVQLQLRYAFKDPLRQNPWKNVFKDYSSAVDAQSDDSILNYIRSSNYVNQKGELTLAKSLKQLPAQWDVNGDGKWNGYVPDCYFQFDEQGFDHSPQGEMTGWRAFSYAPFLGTFWPTNGSTDDVIIRLADAFRKNRQGEWDKDVYILNLAIVEALIRRTDIAIAPVDERKYGVDLDGNGQLSTAHHIAYIWPPTEHMTMQYVGEAKMLLGKGRVHLAAGLYPEGTQFLHSVRYVDFDEQGETRLSKRMKELRYAKKSDWNTYAQLKNNAAQEEKEAKQFPDRLRKVEGNPEIGLFTGTGWTYQGFIEDKNGQLRPQTYEETLNCMGCHSGISQTTDTTFAMARKLGADSFQKGWFHPSQKSLRGVHEPRRSDGRFVYTEYLKNNHSGNEFRSNQEIREAFFDKKGHLMPEAVNRLHTDMAFLLYPSPKRALELNKAYRQIVQEQSYIYGRDVHLESLEKTVWKKVPEKEMTGIKSPVLNP